MKLLKLLIAIIIIFFTSCSSNKEEDCYKNIDQDYITGFGGKAYYYTETIQVPCGDNSTDLIDGELPLLENLEYEILKFEFNPDAGNNNTSLYFEVVLKNQNDFEITGIPFFKMKTNNSLEFETSYEQSLKESCSNIPTNSNCTIIVEIKGNNGGNILGLNKIELLEVKYALVRKVR